MTTAPRALVTGGTGNTGSRIAARLSGLGLQVRTAGRRPAPESQDGAATEHVHFDWSAPATHGPALTGVDRVYLVPPTAASDPAAVMLSFLEEARRAGVRRAVLHSSSAIPEDGDGLAEVHRAVRDRFPEWAVLQSSWFMQNFTGDHLHAHSIRSRGEIVTATGDGRVGFVDVEDIAEVGARALADDRAHNTAHLVTGPQALSYAEVAAVVSTVAGRPVRHRGVPYEAMRDRLTGAGIPERFAELLAGMDRDIARGSEDRVSDAVHRVTGRPPRSFADFAAAHADAWPRG